MLSGVQSAGGHLQRPGRPAIRFHTLSDLGRGTGLGDNAVRRLAPQERDRGARPLARKAKSVVIYGADTAGVQLLDALRRTSTYIPVGFVDASPTLWGQTVADLRVYRPERMAGLIQRHDVSEVLLAAPKARRQDRQAALKQPTGLSVSVRTLPRSRTWPRVA